MAEENVIKRIIRLIFDRASAKNTTDAAKKELGKVDEAIEGVSGTLKRLATALAAAFALKKIIDFGKASVSAALTSEKAWSSLAATIDAAGESSERWEKRLRISADAFAAATIHDDDSYAKSLQRLIVLTDDISASTNNMGLIANVAAAFFEGELGPATELVAKVMNGNTTQLRKMGIEATSAQQALEILAQRSMGAATKVGGQLKQVNNLWGEFQEEIGFAIIKSEGGTKAFGALRGIILSMTEWVEKNKEVIGEWVHTGINFAITATDVLYRAIVGLANILQGSFNAGLGMAVLGLAKLTSGYAAAVEGAAAFHLAVFRQINTDWLVHAANVRESAKALEEWGQAALEAGKAQAGKGVGTLSAPVFVPGQAPTVPKLAEVAPMIATDSDERLKAEREYWKKMIKLTDDGSLQIHVRQQKLTQLFKKELSIRQEQAASAAGEIFGAALGAGIGPMAAGKAKMNAIEAVELTTRAFIATLNPLTAPLAGGFLAGAAQHAGIAAAWGALSMAFGGGGDKSASVGSGGIGGISAVNASAESARLAALPVQEINVYVDGFDPFNPAHLGRLAAGNQQIHELYGDDAIINVMPRRP